MNKIPETRPPPAIIKISLLKNGSEFLWFQVREINKISNRKHDVDSVNVDWSVLNWFFIFTKVQICDVIPSCIVSLEPSVQHWHAQDACARPKMRDPPPHPSSPLLP